MISIKKVVIIGGGIAGLAAAYTLQEKTDQVQYTLIEKNQELGGKIITINKDGFLVEGGPDCYLAEKPSVTEMARKVGLEDSLLGTNEENKGTFVLSRGKLHNLPEGLMLMVPTKIVPFALSPLISWPGKIRMSFDLFLPKKKQFSDETLKSFVVRRLGQEALDKIAEPLIGGIHGGDPGTMSLKASFPRFLDMESKYGSLTKAMLAARKRVPKMKPNPSSKIPKTYFVSFKEGMGELVKAMEQRFTGKIIKGKSVTKVEKVQQGYQVFIEDDKPLMADGIIFAIPAHDAAKLMGKLDSVIAQKLKETPMASSATISVGYKRKDIPGALNSFGFVVPNIEKRKINAVTYSSVKWHHRVPNDDFVLLRTFVGGAKNSHLAHASEEEILQWVKQEFKEVLGITAEPVMTSVYRWLNARPQYVLGHLERMEEIENRLENLPGLYLAGGSYRGIGVPDCLKDGIKAAENSLEFLGI